MSSKSPALPEKWEKALSRVESMLGETMASTARHLEIIEGEIADGEAALARIREIFRMKALQDGLEQHLLAARLTTAEADLVLAGGEKVVREYLAEAEAVRQKLADWS